MVSIEIVEDVNLGFRWDLFVVEVCVWIGDFVLLVLGFGVF